MILLLVFEREPELDIWRCPGEPGDSQGRGDGDAPVPDRLQQSLCFSLPLYLEISNKFTESVK